LCPLGSFLIFLFFSPQLDQEYFGDPSRNFFEILRFDFIIDETLQANLMEVQISPQLAIRKDTKFELRHSYRSQLIYDALSVLHLLDFNEQKDENFFLSDPRDVSISLSETNMTNCRIECDDKCSNECNLCAFCLGKSRILQQTFREHMRRRHMKRIFPKAIHFNKNKLIGRMHSSSKFILKWIHEMCAVESEWC
jgi:tubulin monoglycylase TTLL15